MKKILSLIALAGAFALNANAGLVTLLDGRTSSVINVPLYGGTNGSGIYTNTFQNGQVPGASNIVYQLAGSTGLQPNFGTNGFLPSAVDNLTGYPNTLYGPQNYVTIVTTGNLLATNATSTAVVFRFAASADGGTGSAGLWVTNYAVVTLTIPINATSSTQPCSTNTVATGGWNYLALQAIENPGVSALTNIVVEVSGKPGL